MGVSIYENSGTHSVHMGAYSTFNAFRKTCILYAINYCKAIQQKEYVEPHLLEPFAKDDEEQMEESLDELIAVLQNWYDADTWIPGDITQDIHRWHMTGLLHFINCYDDSGVWSLGQCMDIVDFFGAIIRSNVTSDNTLLSNLKHVFQYAVDHNGYVSRG